MDLDQDWRIHGVRRVVLYIFRERDRGEGEGEMRQGPVGGLEYRRSHSGAELIIEDRSIMVAGSLASWNVLIFAWLVLRRTGAVLLTFEGASYFATLL